jgi:adenylylsulfate kinase
MGGMALWITGLPGSGKSTIADLLKEVHPAFVILRMDEFRMIVTPEPTYSESEREHVYRSLVYIAKLLTGLGHDVIIDATGNMRKWRELARRLIPNYVETYLKCPVALCRERERQRRETHGAPRDIYQRGEKGCPVPGINVPYEEPLVPEIVVDTVCTSVETTVAIINDYLTRNGSCRFLENRASES